MSSEPPPEKEDIHSASSSAAATPKTPSSPPPPPQEKKRCKHCREWVYGSHDDRKLHFRDCTKRIETKREKRRQQQQQGSNGHDDDVVQNRPAEEEERSVVTRVEKETCPTCGAMFPLGSHDFAACKQKKGGATFRCRQRSKSEVEATINKRRQLNQLSVTPDISEYDRRMKQLVQRQLPVVTKEQSMVSADHWAYCGYCGKRLVASCIPEHEAVSCIVKSLLSKVDTLVDRVSLAEASRDRRSSALRTNRSSGKQTSSSNSKKKKKKFTVGKSLSTFDVLDPKDALVEECRQLVAVIDAVVPIGDLFLSCASHLTPVVDPTPEDIRPCLVDIRMRVQQWADEFQEKGSGSEDEEGTSQTQDRSQRRSSRRRRGDDSDAKSQGGESTVSRGTLGNVSSVARSSRMGTSVGTASSGKGGFFLPKLSKVLHGPKLHLSATSVRSSSSALERSAELARTKTSRYLGGNGYDASSAVRSTKGRSTSSTTNDHNTEREMDSVGEEDPQPYFDEQTLALARLIVSGELSLDEALRRDQKGTNGDNNNSASRVRFK